MNGQQRQHGMGGCLLILGGTLGLVLLVGLGANWWIVVYPNGGTERHAEFAFVDLGEQTQWFRSAVLRFCL